jgi:hypothetical protein
MTSPRRIWIGLLLAGLGGCGIQDPTQPPVGSISVGARKEGVAPSLPPGKTKAAPADRK